MLTTLSRCDGFKDSEIHLFLDGPKGSHDRNDVKEVWSFASNLRLDNLTIRRSETNKGLRRSIYDGVSELTATHGAAIVFEDDLRASPAALTYFNSALNRYRDDPRVWSISGFMYDVPALAERRTAFFLPYATSWGWATWHRAWSQFDALSDPPEELYSSRAFVKAFSANGIGDFATVLRTASLGLIDSWWIRWYFTIFMAGGVSLFPPTTLVDNAGFGSQGGTHTNPLNPYNRLQRNRALATGPPVLPESVVIDYPALDVIASSRNVRLIKAIQRVGTLRRLFRHHVRKFRMASAKAE